MKNRELLRINGDTAICRCLNCNKEFSEDLSGMEEWRRNSFLENMSTNFCEKCESDILAKETKRREESEFAELEKEAGLPLKLIIKPYPSPRVVAWIKKNINSNILLSGETGTGKTTSAVAVLSELLRTRNNIRIMYCNMLTLVSRWVKVKKSDDYGVEAFLLELGDLDYLVIDEVIGKAKISETGQELLFELLDGVYNGTRKTKIWMLGNFYKGSIDSLFSDIAPAKRRLRETFASGRITESRNVEAVGI